MQLDLPPDRIQDARALSSGIVCHVASMLAGRSTIGIERATARLLGLNGADASGVPWANLLVDRLAAIGRLSDGVARFLAELQITSRLPVVEAATAFLKGVLPSPGQSPASRDLDLAVRRNALLVRRTLCGVRATRDKLIQEHGDPQRPWLYVIVATGDIREDIVQARLAARHGADVIAVIRSTAQSLLEHVPEGLTYEGYGGTYATQANFRAMRTTLDEVSRELGRYIRLVNYASGLCMPEIAVLGAQERLDMMLSDSMYGILFRDINAERTLIDQHFARTIQGLAGIVINTGEDNYLTTQDAVEAAPTVLASQFINEAFALRAGMPPVLMGLGHAFEMEPSIENGLLLQIADALTSRACFPEAPLKYMPPTRHVTGDLFFAHAMNALFNLTSAITSQTIHLVGVLSEGAHTPFMHERFLAIDNARYVHRYAREFAESFQIVPDGLVARRAHHVLERAVELLRDVASRSLFEAIEDGVFAGIRRPRLGGRGREGVFETSEHYLDFLQVVAEQDT